jgi:ribosomal protein S20
MLSNGIASQFLGLTRPQPSGDQQELRANVRSLIDAIKSGDLDAAKDAFAKIEEALNAKAKSEEAKEDASKSPFEALLDALGKALASNDIEAAQEALAAFEANRPKVPPALGRADADPLSGDVKGAFIELIKALRADDLTGAKEAFEKLTERKSEEAAADKSRLDRFLEQVAAALEADDLAAAKDALHDLTLFQPIGAAVDLTA